MMNTEQKKTLLEFVFSAPTTMGTNSNPFIYGKPWAVGDSYTVAEKDAFNTQWANFSARHPDIAEQLPTRS